MPQLNKLLHGKGVSLLLNLFYALIHKYLCRHNGKIYNNKKVLTFIFLKFVFIFSGLGNQPNSKRLACFSF